MGLTKYALDCFISERIANVTECNLSDLSKEYPGYEKWVTGFGMMVIFNNQPPEKFRPMALQFVRRAEMAFVEYASARKEIGNYIEKPSEWSLYFRALHHIETSLSMTYQALDYSRKATGKKFFEKHNDTPAYKLNLIYNTSKHQLAGEDQPLWITNEGLKTKETSLTYVDLEGILKTCGYIANTMTSTIELKKFFETNV